MQPGVPCLGFKRKDQADIVTFAAVFLIRTGIMGRDMSGRECERLLQPDEIWLPWDYVLAEPPGSCASRVLCAALVLWCCVMYCAQRIIHFRASKETFFTTPRLDKAARVWFTGAPKHAYQALDETIETE
eukprot:Skav233685  [mRNA]  locus=scaffold1927:171483:177795:- [translate_table: standard]